MLVCSAMMIFKFMIHACLITGLCVSYTEEQAFRKRRLCIKFIPRDSTEAAICDIRILGRSKQAPPQYTFIG